MAWLDKVCTCVYRFGRGGGSVCACYNQTPPPQSGASGHNNTHTHTHSPNYQPPPPPIVWRQWSVGDVVQVLNNEATPSSVVKDNPPELAWYG